MSFILYVYIHMFSYFSFFNSKIGFITYKIKQYIHCFKRMKIRMDINVLDSDTIFIYGEKNTHNLYINRLNKDTRIKTLFMFGFFFICCETYIWTHFISVFNLYSFTVINGFFYCKIESGY